MNDQSELHLRRQLRALAREQPPQRDLWPQIAAALPARQRPATRRRPAPALWALAAGLVLALGLVLVPATDRAPPAPALVAQPIPDSADSADVLLAAYHQVLAAEQAWGERHPGGGAAPGAVERVAAARELDASLADLAAALRVEPRSQLLRRLMHQTLQQRTALIRDAIAA